MKSKVYKVVLIMVIALVLAAPVVAGIGGSGISGIQVQNLDTLADGKIIVQLYNQNGSTPVTVSATGGDSVKAGASKSYYMPSLAGVNSGSYAMVVSSASPIAAIVRTEWSTTGGAGFYGSVAPGTDILVPLVTYQYASQTSQITIQNTDTVNALSGVKVDLYGRGIANPVGTKTINSIPKGSSVTFDVTPAFFGLGSLPNTALDLGASGFLGSMRISHTTTPMVVQSFIDVAGSRGVSAFVGVDATSAENTAYCPLVRANYYGDTGISIVNPDKAQEVTGTITFYADARSPKKGTFVQSFTIPANSSFSAFQGPTGNSRSAPTNLPGGTQSAANPTPTNDGFFGVAKIVASGAVLATVNDVLFGSGWTVQQQSTYNCATSLEAGDHIALPLIRKKHLSSAKLTTGVQIQNTCNNRISVQMQVFNWDGTRQAASDPAPLVIPAYGSGNLYQDFLTNLPTVPPSQGGFGWYGSAQLIVTPLDSATCGNVVVQVSDENFPGPVSLKFDSANYMGLLFP